MLSLSLIRDGNYSTISQSHHCDWVWLKDITYTLYKKRKTSFEWNAQNVCVFRDGRSGTSWYYYYTIAWYNKKIIYRKTCLNGVFFLKKKINRKNNNNIGNKYYFVCNVIYKYIIMIRIFKYCYGCTVHCTRDILVLLSLFRLQQLNAKFEIYIFLSIF